MVPWPPIATAEALARMGPLMVMLGMLHCSRLASISVGTIWVHTDDPVDPAWASCGLFAAKTPQSKPG